MKPYVPIGCADYEYIETGEYLIVQLDNNQRESVRVDQINQIVVLSENRHFDERTFEPLADPR